MLLYYLAIVVTDTDGLGEAGFDLGQFNGFLSSLGSLTLQILQSLFDWTSRNRAVEFDGLEAFNLHVDFIVANTLETDSTLEQSTGKLVLEGGDSGSSQSSVRVFILVASLEANVGDSCSNYIRKSVY